MLLPLIRQLLHKHTVNCSFLDNLIRSNDAECKWKSFRLRTWSVGKFVDMTKTFQMVSALVLRLFFSNLLVFETVTRTSPPLSTQSNRMRAPHAQYVSDASEVAGSNEMQYETTVVHTTDQSDKISIQNKTKNRDRSSFGVFYLCPCACRTSISVGFRWISRLSIINNEHNRYINSQLCVRNIIRTPAFFSVL